MMDIPDKIEIIKPWGGEEHFCFNTQVTVKILSVKPHSSLSLQYHFKRNEFWKIIKGAAKITVGEKIYDAKEGDEFVIPKNAKHRIETEEHHAKIMEISYGEFDAEDIVRIDDKYNRHENKKI